MSTDLRRISFFAVLFLVLIRISIGWQFLYEGLWKYNSQSSAKPWTSKGYLLNAQGPFRERFRSLVDDPNEELWLDYDQVSGSWESWQKQFASHYQLDEAQKTRLDVLLNGEKNFEEPLEHLPDAVEFDGSLGSRIGYKPDTKMLYLKLPFEMKEPHWDRLLNKMGITEKQEPEYFASARSPQKESGHPAVFEGAQTEFGAQCRLDRRRNYR